LPGFRYNNRFSKALAGLLVLKRKKEARRMANIGKQRVMPLRFAMVTAALLLSGCSILSPQPVTVEPAPEPAIEPTVDGVIVAPEPTPPPQPPPPQIAAPTPRKLPAVAIVLSSSQPAYADVAAALVLQFENHTVYDLSDPHRTPVGTLRLINDSNSHAVVAIGLRAAQSSVAMSEKPVVFSQVFNYQNHELLVGDNRGVAAYAPLAAQVAAWLEFNPDIVRIGTIIGPGHDDLMAAAQLAADANGVELRVAVSHSDQETQFVFKRMVRDIDGFWLFPDNRVLSRRALLEIMRGAERQSVSVLVPTEAMLKIGASISIGTVATNIADTITNIIRKIQAGQLEQIPALSQLSEIRVITNSGSQVASQ
jgi:ABC-type uncharacterized transport system substrate-binding protein